jgi:4-diphosphocytidyl-2-C-methyl-D-erythritol kinase
MPNVQSIHIVAPAKINLFLKILAKETSGYHQLETLYAAVDFGDEIVVSRTKGGGTRGVALEVIGPSLGPVEENLAYRAATALLDAAGSSERVHLRLTKKIPVGAGFGGGSSDAGATLRALNTLLGEPVSGSVLLELAGQLGADVPFFASGAGMALAWGRGERLLPLPGAAGLVILLALSPLHIATAEAYQALRIADIVAPATLALDELARGDTLAELAMNDFEAGVFERHPELGALRGAIQEAGALTARLSGSGSGLFGLFSDQETADHARDSLSRSWAAVRFVRTETVLFQPEPSASPSLQ